MWSCKFCHNPLQQYWRRFLWLQRQTLKTRAHIPAPVAVTTNGKLQRLFEVSSPKRGFISFLFISLFINVLFGRWDTHSASLVKLQAGCNQQTWNWSQEYSVWRHWGKVFANRCLRLKKINWLTVWEWYDRIPDLHKISRTAGLLSGWTQGGGKELQRWLHTPDSNRLLWLVLFL